MFFVHKLCFYLLVASTGLVNVQANINSADTTSKNGGSSCTNDKWTTSEDPIHQHPVDPLTESEIKLTSSIISGFVEKTRWLFIYIGLKEPDKSALLPYFLNNTNPPPVSIPRKSFTILLDRERNQGFEVVVNLDRKRIDSWTSSAHKIATACTAEEIKSAEIILRKDERVVERSRALGWTNMSLVTANGWPIGYVGDQKEYQDKRLFQMFLYGKLFEDDNQYAHPFDFLAVIDLIEGKVIAIEELPTHDDFDAGNKTGNDVPRATAHYRPDTRPVCAYMKDLHPVRITQPDGASFKITGNEIKWQRFKMRLGFNGREGLVIYNVNFNDHGNVRPLFYRMSMAETFVPYGDPRPPYHRKAAFDEGGLGLGFAMNELQPQVECIGHVEYFHFVLHNDRGEAIRKPRVVCVHEEDAGILWKHSDSKTGKNTVVRSQRLSITFAATIGNYNYIFTWNFYQDGTIEFHAQLTGLLNLSLVAVNATFSDHATIVAPQIAAQYHQHFFSLRLDAEIDGNKNSVVMQDAIPLEAPTGSSENPYGQGIITRRTLLKTAGEGRTKIAVEKSRTWHIINPNSLHPYTKQPVGWKLTPWSTPKLLLRRDSPLYPQVEWLEHNTWITPYKEGQLFSGGAYLNNSGLPEWVRKDVNANIDNTDIVIWHNIGVTHIPRAEEYPVMPAESCGIALKPVNFFRESPALDVPPQAAVL